MAIIDVFLGLFQIVERIMKELRLTKAKARLSLALRK